MTPVTLYDIDRTAQQVATGPDTLTSYQIKNGNGYTIYVKFYDKLSGSIDISSDTPDEVVTVPANSTVTSDNFSFEFTSALSIRCTKVNTNDDNTKVSVLPLVELQFTPFIVHAASVTLNNAQILTLPTVPVEVIPAPGAGKIVIPIAGFVLQSWPDGYGAIDSPFLVVGTDGLGDTACFFSIDDDTYGFFSNPWGSEIRGVSCFSWGQFGLPAAPSAVLNQGESDTSGKAIVVRATNGSNVNFTGGGTSNTLKVTIYYALVDL